MFFLTARKHTICFFPPHEHLEIEYPKFYSWKNFSNLVQVNCIFWWPFPKTQTRGILLLSSNIGKSWFLHLNEFSHVWMFLDTIRRKVILSSKNSIANLAEKLAFPRNVYTHFSSFLHLEAFECFWITFAWLFSTRMNITFHQSFQNHF